MLRMRRAMKLSPAQIRLLKNRNGSKLTHRAQWDGEIMEVKAAYFPRVFFPSEEVRETFEIASLKVEHSDFDVGPVDATWLFCFAVVDEVTYSAAILPKYCSTDAEICIPL